MSSDVNCIRERGASNQEEQNALLSEAARQFAAVTIVRDEDGDLIAPNGEKSALTERQYRQVRTPWFKEWFGDWENTEQALLERLHINHPVFGRETIGEALKRHEVPRTENGLFALYHATPKDTAFEDLRAGSYLAKDEATARHQAARDRGLDKASDIRVERMLVKPDEVDPSGPFWVTRKSIPCDRDEETSYYAEASVTVDPRTGEPMPFYNGGPTPATFEEFSTSFCRKGITRSETGSLGFFLTSERDNALYFAEDDDCVGEYWVRLLNPREPQHQNELAPSPLAYKALEEVYFEDKEYDGVMSRGVIDGHYRSDIVVVFPDDETTSNIKSTSNSGIFAEDSSLRDERPKLLFTDYVPLSLPALIEVPTAGGQTHVR